MRLLFHYRCEAEATKSEKQQSRTSLGHRLCVEHLRIFSKSPKIMIDLGETVVCNLNYV